MDTKKEKYDEIAKKRNKIIEELNLLEENETVKRYLSLNQENTKLFNEQRVLYKDIKEEEYSSCKHILVYSKVNYDRYEGRSNRRCGCIKCGLDNSVLDCRYEEFLSYDDRIMYDYLIDGNYLKGIETNISCDLSLAVAIYQKIKGHYPDIDDDTAIKYFMVALNDIREIEVNEERKASRVKRLGLNPNFTSWYSKDVRNG